MEKSWLEVIDRDGWRKKCSLEKSIVYIGRHPRNDIILEADRGTNVADLHAQLIAANNGAGYQLVNLTDTDIAVGINGTQTLSPHTAINIADGETFLLGEFTLVFHSAGSSNAAGQSNSSRNIGLSMSLPQMRLAPNRSLDGVMRVSNLGEKSGVKFELELEGLSPDCYDLEPGPLLSTGAEQDVLIRLHHHGTKPDAGPVKITIYATAPRAYPADMATVSQIIEVMPYYHHQIKLLPDPEDKQAVAKEPETNAQEDQPLLTEKPQADIEPDQHRPKEIDKLEPSPVTPQTETTGDAEQKPVSKARAESTLPAKEDNDAVGSAYGLKHWWSRVTASFLSRRQPADISDHIESQPSPNAVEAEATDIQSADIASPPKKVVQFEADETNLSSDAEISEAPPLAPKAEPVLEVEEISKFEDETAEPETLQASTVDEVEPSPESTSNQQGSIEADTPVAADEEVVEVPHDLGEEMLLKTQPEPISDDEAQPMVIEEQEPEPQVLQEDWPITNVTDEETQPDTLAIEDDNIWEPAAEKLPSNVVEEDIWDSSLEDEEPPTTIKRESTDESAVDDIWSSELESATSVSRQERQVLTLKAESSSQITNTSLTAVKSDLSPSDTEDWWLDSDADSPAQTKREQAKNDEANEVGK